MTIEMSLMRRAEVHAALADPHRLELVDGLALSERTPSELGASLGIGSNLLAHHLGVLEAAGIVERQASAGDGRRRYVRLVPDVLAVIAYPVVTIMARHVLFVCKANSARSQLAAAVWNARHPVPASSAGTRPARAVHPAAIEAGLRAGLDLRHARPRSLEELDDRPDLVVTVCDVAREELPDVIDGVPLLHWSIPDPARSGTSSAFDKALDRITSRVETLAPHVQPSRRPRRSRP